MEIRKLFYHACNFCCEVVLTLLDAVANLIIRILGEQPSAFMISTVIFFAAVLLTQVMSNIPTILVFMPIGLSIAEKIGVSPYPIAMWCGCQECEDQLKESVGVTSRCMPFAQETLSDKCVCCGKPATKMVYWGKAY